MAALRTPIVLTVASVTLRMLNILIGVVMTVDELATCEAFPEFEHLHLDPCATCGDVHYVYLWIPGRAMGGGWVQGMSQRRCRTCDALRSDHKW